MRLFLDANILFSAAYRAESPANLLFDLQDAAHCRFMTSDFAWEEARRNIALKRPERLDALTLLSSHLERTPVPDPSYVSSVLGYGLPDKDAPILAAALLGHADLLVTGDRTHFGHLYGRQIDGLTVSTLASALEALT